ncbi:sulfate transport system substrate-binding protein [Roseovarius pacificus]|uniref:Sulfate transport system substrate-binding protein n=1 Tax=Roseovarius pacificus TaxID=337701 RepID=A0A1M7GF52_9RHOB|nr:sulfate ABC transporter substrate-binding protein [Roseovarius pacificus]GGO60004.1 sulfate adenylyltransferase [Roseovarius pacificus]SHM14748.1 sulfate transport system substrate-binding protein [Roseovarius pacificus]
MIHTISTGPHALAQGKFIRSLGDGRIEIDAGGRILIGTPVTRRHSVSHGKSPFLRALTAPRWKTGLFAAVSALAVTFGNVPAARAQDPVEILNVSYDPTREFYRQYNELFNAWWTGEGHEAVTLRQSHGGSGGQARSVIDGLEATVVTLALSADISAIADRSGKIPEDWQSRLPHNSSPYTSTIVFLVRDGNPKGIADWDDLANDGVEVITPNPKTSGGARWNFMAAWAWALEEFDGDEDQARAYMASLYRNVPVLDTGARGSTNTFTQRGIGDVLLAWENEAFLALAEQGEDAFDIVVPSVSMLAEPPVTLVDGNITSDAQREAAEAYLEHLYSPEAQALALKNFYRAWDTSAATEEDIARFPEVERLSIDEFGGWAEVQPVFFGDGGIFDQIFEEQ